MTTLVTGSLGLIGRSVVRQLAESGQSVIATDIAADAQGLMATPYERLDITSGDQIREMLRKREVSRVIHLGALITDNSHANPYLALQTNVMGLANLLEAARSYPLESVVYASTVGVYGPARLYATPVNEDMPLMPPNVYGGTKLMNEVTAEHYKKAYGLPVLGLRPAYAFGPGRYSGAVGQFNKVVRDAALGKPVKWMRVFSRDTVLNPLYVDDMAAAFIKGASCGPLPHSVYNIGGEEGFLEREMIDIVRHCLSEAVEIEELPPSGEYELSVPEIDCRRFIRESGFLPKYSFKEAVEHMIQHYRDSIG